MGIQSYGLRPPQRGYAPPPQPRQSLMPSPYLDDVIGEMPEQNPMWPPPEGIGGIGELPGPQGSPLPPAPRAAPLAPEDPYLTDQIREQTQLSPISAPPAMPMQMPGPDPANPGQGQFRVANTPPMGQPGMPPIPPPDNARQSPPPAPPGSQELEYLRQTQAARPEQPQPKWWQIAGAAAAGGLEGYLASSPSAATRSAVRQPGRLSQMLTEGDYPQRMQEWQIDLKNAQDLLDASLDIQKSRSQQQLQEAQAWRYRNEPGIKADTALDVQESRNRGQITRAQAIAAGYQDTATLKDQLSLREVTPDRVKELDARGHKPITFTDEPGKFYFHESTLKEVEKSRLKDDEMAFDYSLGQDKLKSAEAIAEENRKSRESINKHTQSQTWARQDARLRAERQKAGAGGDDKFEKAKIDRLGKIENTYHKGVTDLAKQFKFADTYDPKTPEMLTGPAAEQYWTQRLTIEKTFRDQRNEAERLYARQKGVDTPYIYQPEEGETYATRKLEEIRTKAQGASGAAQSGNPQMVTGSGAGSSGQSAPGKLSLPPGLKLPAGYTEAPGGKVQGPDGSMYNLDPQTKKLKKIK